MPMVTMSQVQVIYHTDGDTNMIYATDDSRLPKKYESPNGADDTLMAEVLGKLTANLLRGTAVSLNIVNGNFIASQGAPAPAAAAARAPMLGKKPVPLAAGKKPKKPTKPTPKERKVLQAHFLKHSKIRLPSK